jgi:hypothetical protein
MPKDLAKVQLYCNAATSEVTGEHPTLHDAAAMPSIPGAVLICHGVILAAAGADGGWIFEQAGVERLNTEYNVTLECSINLKLARQTS